MHIDLTDLVTLNVRALLLRADETYPGTTFTGRVGRDTIDLRWEDGPTREAVAEALATHMTVTGTMQLGDETVKIEKPAVALRRSLTPAGTGLVVGNVLSQLRELPRIPEEILDEVDAEAQDGPFDARTCLDVGTAIGILLPSLEASPLRTVLTAAKEAAAGACLTDHRAYLAACERSETVECFAALVRDLDLRCVQSALVYGITGGWAAARSLTS